MSKKYTYLMPWLVLLLTSAAYAGNPDRQGEAGANQLLVNPWARSAGFHSMNTSSVSGTEAMFLNVSGLSRINGTQIQLAHTRYLVNSDINLNAFGFGQRIGKSGAFGISLVAFDLGDFDLTTEDVPEGSGAQFSPSFFNLGISYAHLFANKVSVGLSLKFVNEGITNVRASAMCLDAGVQYVAGEKDNFKFGISLRNIGSKMRFQGEGLSKALPNPGPTFPYNNTYYERATGFELPSQLNIGMSYDWLLGSISRLSMVLNFTSNSFSRDQIGGGLEFSLSQNFSLRGGYKYELDQAAGEETVDNGFSGGFSVGLPVKKGSDTRIALDYGYRHTKIFQGIHNIGIRLDM